MHIYMSFGHFLEHSWASCEACAEFSWERLLRWSVIATSVPPCLSCTYICRGEVRGSYMKSDNNALAVQNNTGKHFPFHCVPIKPKHRLLPKRLLKIEKDAATADEKSREKSKPVSKHNIMSLIETKAMNSHQLFFSFLF